MVVGQNKEHHSSGAPREQGTAPPAPAESSSSNRNAIQWDAAEAGRFEKVEAEVSSSGDYNTYTQEASTMSIKDFDNEGVKANSVDLQMRSGDDVATAADGVGKDGKRTKNKRLRRAARTNKNSKESSVLEKDEKQLLSSEQEQQTSITDSDLKLNNRDADPWKMDPTRKHNATSLHHSRSRSRATVSDMITKSQQGGQKQSQKQDGAASSFVFELLNDKMVYLYDRKGSFPGVQASPLEYNLNGATSWPSCCSHGITGNSVLPRVFVD